MSLLTYGGLYNIGMHFDPHSALEIASPPVEMTAPEMSALFDAKEREFIRLRRQVAWFQRKIVGQKSERRMPKLEGVQGTLGEAFDVVPDNAAAPAQPDRAVHAMSALYKIKQQIRDDGLTVQAKPTRRQEHANPVLDRFFAWIGGQFDKQGFLPSSPFLDALACI